MIINWQGQGEHSKEFKEYKQDYIAFTGEINKLNHYPRYWENWAVLYNLDVKKSDVILEFGAWPHFFGVYLSRFCKEIHITDNYEWTDTYESLRDQELDRREWVDKIYKYGKYNISTQQVDITDSKYINIKFDKIVSCSVLEHIKDDLKALNEIARILKDDGKVVMTIDFKKGEAVPYYQTGRVYNKARLMSVIDRSNLKLVNKSLEGLECIDEEDGIIFALVIVLEKK
jgi:SAM-dependent methyltransferase